MNIKKDGVKMAELVDGSNRIDSALLNETADVLKGAMSPGFGNHITQAANLLTTHRLLPVGQYDTLMRVYDIATRPDEQPTVINVGKTELRATTPDGAEYRLLPIAEHAALVRQAALCEAKDREIAEMVEQATSARAVWEEDQAKIRHLERWVRTMEDASDIWSKECERLAAEIKAATAPAGEKGAEARIAESNADLAGERAGRERAEKEAEQNFKNADELLAANDHMLGVALELERERDEAQGTVLDFLAKIRALKRQLDFLPNGLYSTRKKAAEFDTLAEATRALLGHVKAFCAVVWEENAVDMPDDMLTAYKAAEKALGPVGDGPLTVTPKQAKDMANRMLDFHMSQPPRIIMTDPRTGKIVGVISNLADEPDEEGGEG